MTKLEKERRHRKQNNNQCTKKYEKTFNGFIMRMYRNMKSRISGVQQKKCHLYEGKFLLAKEKFYSICSSDPRFLCLFHTWKNSDYDRKLTPSVNRINSKIGYTESNIEFVTHSENSRLGGINRWKTL